MDLPEEAMFEDAEEDGVEVPQAAQTKPAPKAAAPAVVAVAAAPAAKPAAPATSAAPKAWGAAGTAAKTAQSSTGPRSVTFATKEDVSAQAPVLQAEEFPTLGAAPSKAPVWIKSGEAISNTDARQHPSKQLVTVPHITPFDVLLNPPTADSATTATATTTATTASSTSADVGAADEGAAVLAKAEAEQETEEGAFISSGPKVEVMVVDTAGFIKNSPLERMAHEVVTIPEVIAEIRDRVTRERLLTVPYEIKYRTPSSDALHAVSSFARLTGDLRSLSATDLKVLALAYMMETEKNGTAHIAKEPRKIEIRTPGCLPTPCRFGANCARINTCWYQHPESEEDGDGVTEVDSFGEEEQEEQEEQGEGEATQGQQEQQQQQQQEQQQTEQGGEEGEEKKKKAETEDDDILLNCFFPGDKKKGKNKKGAAAAAAVATLAAAAEGQEQAPAAQAQQTPAQGTALSDPFPSRDPFPPRARKASERSHVSAASTLPVGNLLPGWGGNADGDEDERGWINPQNVKAVASTLQQPNLTEPARLKVGVITTDFAMQNVLLQMGMKVVSVDGMLVKRVKTFLLRCETCFKTTAEVTRDFCPSCGHQTLYKVAYSVNQDGIAQCSDTRRRAPRLRGTVFPLPLPQGGRRDQIILREDQKEYAKAVALAKRKTKVTDDDLVTSNAPFTTVHKVNQKGGLRSNKDQQLQFGANRKNPNEKKPTRKGKRNK